MSTDILNRPKGKEDSQEEAHEICSLTAKYYIYNGTGLSSECRAPLRLVQTSSLPQWPLSILGATCNDVFQLPPGRLDESLALSLDILLLHLASNTSRQRLQTSSNTSRELDLKDITHFVAGGEKAIQIFLVVRSRYAEAGAGADKRRSGISDDDDRDLALEHFVTERRDLAGVVKHDGDDRRVIVAINNETKTLKSETEVTRVEGNALKTFLALAGSKLTLDNSERSENLHQDSRRRRFTEEGSSVGSLELIDDVLLSRNVTAVSTEGLGQGSHENVDFSRVNLEVIADTTAVRTDGTDTVSLIDIEEELVLLLESQDTGEIAHGSFHRVETFDSDKDLLPRAVSTGLTLSNSLTKELLKFLHIVVLERPDDSSRKTGTNTDGGMVELIRNNEVTLGNERREGTSVGDEAHRENHSSGLANELCNFTFNLDGEIRCTNIGARAAAAETILANALLDGISARTNGLGETKIVVRAHVQGLRAGTGVLVVAVEIIRLAVEESDVTAGDASSGSGEAVVDAHLESTDVEVVEIIVQGCVAILYPEGLVMGLISEPLAEEVAGVTEED